MSKKVKIGIENLTKIFGKNPEKVLSLLEEGYTKDEIFEKTKQTVGLNDVNFDVYEGEIFVLMGLSGSGKSTLLRCLNRLIDPTSGKILIDGEDISTMNEEELRKVRRAKLGMVFQNFALLPHRTVLENVAYGLEIQGIPKGERYPKAIEAINTVGLKGYEESKINQLSGGMKQRVGLARALANDPDILLMDEAFSALDPLIRSEMQDELLSLEVKLQKTIVFVSHDLDEALKLGDRIALMKDGEIVQIGTPEEILTDPADNYVSQFVRGVDRSKVLTAENVMWRPEPLVSVSSGPRVAVQLMKEHGISSIFVVEGKNRVLKGLLVIDDAVEALKSKKSFEPMIRGVPSLSLDMPLYEIIPLIADSEYPLPVVDDNNKLRGIIVRGTVLGALAMSEDVPEEMEALAEEKEASAEEMETLAVEKERGGPVQGAENEAVSERGQSGNSSGESSGESSGDSSGKPVDEKELSPSEEKPGQTPETTRVKT